MLSPLQPLLTNSHCREIADPHPPGREPRIQAIQWDADEIRVCFVNEGLSPFLSFDDIIDVVAPFTNWNDKRTKFRRTQKYKQRFSGNDKYAMIFKDEVFIEPSAMSYIIHDLMFQNELVPGTPAAERVVTFLNSLLVPRDNLPCHHYNVTNERNVVSFLGASTVPPSLKHLPLDNQVGIPVDIPHPLPANCSASKIKHFENDCRRLGLQSAEDRLWYAETLSMLSNIMPRINKIVNLEIEYQASIDRRLNNSDFDLLFEYSSKTSWALKLFAELSCVDRTKSPSAEKHFNHDVKKIRQRFFLIHYLFHIRNAQYAGPLTKELGDVLYTRHQDIDYLYNLLSHIGITECLKVIRNRQEKLSITRDVGEEISSLGSRSYVYVYDNFNKTHGTHSTVFGDSQTRTVECINRAVVALPPTSPCPDQRCQVNGCIDSCLWSRERPTDSINFDEINCTSIEQKAMDTFRLKRSNMALKEVSKTFRALQGLMALSCEDLVQAFDDEPPDSSVNIDSRDAFYATESKIYIDRIQSSLKPRSELRNILTELHQPENIETNRVILPAVGGKDTDPNLARVLLDQAIDILPSSDTNERIFIGGDQKTMGLAYRLRSNFATSYKSVYVTIPDLHFRKSLMHAIMMKYEHLGLRHLAKLCGFTTAAQWEYLKNVASIHKTFEFFERLSDSLHIALIYEFISSLVDKNPSLNFIESLQGNDLSEVWSRLPSLESFVQDRSSDQVFTKNIELLNEVDNIIAHYSAERSRNWDLRNASLKLSLPFAMVSNCTQYGPLLIELLFHQFSQQKRYLQLMKDGYFTHKLRNRETSAFVGYDAVIEDCNLLAGRFRHKRQSLSQAITQSNCIGSLQETNERLDANINIHRSSSEKVFKDDRETKLRIVRALLNFRSFHDQSRCLTNEFSTSAKTSYNLEILRQHWLPVAQYLIRRYVRSNETTSLCNKQSILDQSDVLTKTSSELMKRVSKSSSIVINIKPVAATRSKTSDSMKRRVRDFTKRLQWELSPFEPAAAILNHDGSKLNSNKSQFRKALLRHFDSSSELTAASTDTDPIGPTAWLSDYQLHACLQLIGNAHENQCIISYPVNEETLDEMLSSQGRTDIVEQLLHQKACLIVPLNVGGHWVTILFDGGNETILYVDSFGNGPSDFTRKVLSCKFDKWQSAYNEVRLQNDGFQCGIWVCAVSVIFLEFVVNRNSDSAIDFHNYFKAALTVRNLTDTSINQQSINSAWIATFRASLTQQLLPSSTGITQQNQCTMDASSAECISSSIVKNCFPEQIKFEVASVDAQHTLWTVPAASSGIEYISHLGRSHWNRYFNKVSVKTLYWNYDLRSVVQSAVPKGLEQAKRDQQGKANIDMCEDRLLGDSRKVISDQQIITDWNQVRTNRDYRNQIASYVGGSSHHYSLPAGKQLIIQSECMKTGDQYVPQVYTHSDSGNIVRQPSINSANRMGEGEGAAIAHIVQQHCDQNCLVVSNDSDSIVYALLASLQRPRTDGKFTSELWIEVVFSQSKSGVCGTQRKRVSEYWDINQLIYAIEEKLPNLQHPVLAICVIYLCAGCDFTEKWYGKTHDHFLKRFLKYAEYVGDLVHVTGGEIKVLSHAYRKLLHVAWLSNSSNPDSTTFHDLRKKTKTRGNIRLHLPDEQVLRQHYLRASGVLQYMLSYLRNGSDIDWQAYGFVRNDATGAFEPQIFMPGIHPSRPADSSDLTSHGDIRSERAKPQKKTENQINELERAFLSSTFVRGETLCELENRTGLTKKAIQDWFSRKRKVSGKENVQPVKCMRS